MPSLQTAIHIKYKLSYTTLLGQNIDQKLNQSSVWVQEFKAYEAQAHDLLEAKNQALQTFEMNLARTILLEQAFSDEVQKANQLLEDKDQSLKHTEKTTQNLTLKQKLYNKGLSESQKLLKQLSDGIKKINLKKRAWTGLNQLVSNGLNLADQRQAIELPLQIKMQNLGATQAEFESITAHAKALQGTTVFSDQMFLASTAELTKFVSSLDHIKALKDPLATMTASLSGVKATYQDMTKHAQSLGKALNGNLSEMEGAGFVFTDLQKKILQTGTELERVAVITDVVESQMGGLSEALTNTLPGRLQQIRNGLTNIYEGIGRQLQPALLQMATLFYDHLPQIEKLLTNLGVMIMAGAQFFASFVFPILIAGFNQIIEVASAIYDVFANNWTRIEPIIWGLISAFAVYKTVLLGVALAKGMATLAAGALKIMLTKVLALLFKIILPILLIIGLVALAIKTFTNWADEAQNMAGIIVGAVAVIGAFIANLFIFLYNSILIGIETLWNEFVLFANFLGNLFTDPLATIVRRFAEMGDSVLGILETLAKGIDWVFNSNLAGAVSDWRQGLSAKVENTFGPAEEFFQPLDLVQRDYLSLEKAFQGGYDFVGNVSSVLSTPPPIEYESDGNGFNNPLIGALNQQQQVLDDISGSGANTAHNTALMANEVNIADEDLRYLRDIAEKEAINYVIANTIVPQLKVHIEKVDQAADIDDLLNRLEEKVEEELFLYPEGVYA